MEEKFVKVPFDLNPESFHSGQTANTVLQITSDRIRSGHWHLRGISVDVDKDSLVVVLRSAARPLDHESLRFGVVQKASKDFAKLTPVEGEVLQKFERTLDAFYLLTVHGFNVDSSDDSALIPLFYDDNPYTDLSLGIFRYGHIEGLLARGDLDLVDPGMMRIGAYFVKWRTESAWVVGKDPSSLLDGVLSTDDDATAGEE